jgi:hypothetical protein
VSELSDLLLRQPPIAGIAAHLDGLDPSARVLALSRLGRAEQRLLYESAAESPPVDLDFFVPADTRGGWVRHRGTNTLPLPSPLRQFEKRFARPAAATDRLFGYNETRLRLVVGPGYFIAKPSAPTPGWAERGGVVIDYFEVPDDAVPDGWPKVVSNQSGPQRFVYGGTRDFMRRISNDVSIGAVLRGQRPLDHYFTLCRESRAE